MIYLILAIASSALVSICMRLSEKHVKNEMGMFTANYAACVVLSFLFLDTQIAMNFSKPGWVMLGLGLVSGILYLVSFVFMKWNMTYNGIVLSSTFMKLGVLIPTIMAIVVFREMPKWTQLLGIGCSIIAIIMINFDPSAVREGNKKIWLLILLVLSGFTDSMANIYEQVGAAKLKDGYLLVTFIAAFLLAGILAISGKEKISVKDLIYGVIIGIPNYFSARFLLLALGNVEAVLVYPMYSVATIVVVTLVGVTFFKERLGKRRLAALALILLALALLNG